MPPANGSPKNILGTYARDSGSINYDLIPHSIPYALQAAGTKFMESAFDFQQLANKFPWLNTRSYFLLAHRLNHPLVWSQLFSSLSEEDIHTLDQSDRIPLMSDLEKLSHHISIANIKFFAFSTQIGLLAILVGYKNIDMYLSKAIRMATDDISMNRLLKFVGSASEAAKSLEYKFEVKSYDNLEERLKALFTIITDSNGNESTPLYEGLSHNNAFDGCPFVFGTRLLYVQFGKWLKSLPHGYFS